MSYYTQIEGYPDSSQAKPGMAYFSGTGPIGKTCGKCEHLKNRKCQMFKKLAGSIGDNIKASYKSCKYFEPKT